MASQHTKRPTTQQCCNDTPVTQNVDKAARLKLNQLSNKPLAISTLVNVRTYQTNQETKMNQTRHVQSVML